MALKLGEGSESYAPLARAIWVDSVCQLPLPCSWYRPLTCWFMGRNNMHDALAAERRTDRSHGRRPWWDGRDSLCRCGL